MKMLIIKLLYITLISISSINSRYIYRYGYKNQLRNFQPENSWKFKNKPGRPKNRGSYKKKIVYSVIKKIRRIGLPSELNLAR